MKKFGILITAFVLAMATQAQTLNVVTGNVTYQFPAADTGDMTYTDGTTLTICGKAFTISDISKMYTDDTAVTPNQVAIAYNGTTATVTVAGNVAQYVTPTLSGAHVSIQQSNTADVDGDEITYTLSGTSTDGEFYMSGTLALAFKTPASGGTSLVVSASSTPTLQSGVTVTGGTTLWNGMGNTDATVTGGTAAELSSYSSGGGGR